ncbi:MAG: ATP-grasp domain-containing protein [Colwellia sp.]
MTAQELYENNSYVRDTEFFNYYKAILKGNIVQKAVLFFEPLNHMYKVLISISKRGYKVIALHTMPVKAVPPYEEADELIHSSIEINDWYDFKVLEHQISAIKEEFDICGIYAGAEITLSFEAYIKEKLSLPTSGYEITTRNLDKYQVRKRLKAHGLTKLACLSKQELMNLTEWPLSGAGFFKPTNGAGSVNVWRINSIDKLNECKSRWEDKSDIYYDFLKDYIEKSNEYFLEQEAEGDLFSVECMTFEEQTQVLGITSRSVLQRDPAIEMAMSFPFHHSFGEEIEVQVKQYIKVLGIKNGATHTEIIVDSDGNIELIEMNLRFAGSDMLYATSEAFNFDISEALADLVLGQKPKLPDTTTNFASLLLIMPPIELTHFNSIEFPESVKFSRLMKPLGKSIISTTNQIDYLGSCIITAPSYDELLKLSQHVRAEIKVNGQTIQHDTNSQIILM